MSECASSRDMFSMINQQLPTGENLAKAFGPPSDSTNPYHFDLVIEFLPDIVDESLEVNGRSKSLEFVFQDLVEGKSSGTFVIFTYSYDAQIGFIVVGEMSKGDIEFYPEYLSLDWRDTTQHPIADIGSNQSAILYDDGVANWWHPEHPFQTGKWREALYPNPLDSSFSLFDYPVNLDLLHFLPIDFYEDTAYLWFCPPDALNPMGLFNWVW